MKHIVEWIKDSFDLKGKVKRLKEDRSRLYDKVHELRIRLSGKYKIIYNPIGEDMWTINSNNTAYIQGKPRTLMGFDCDEIIVVNSNNIDMEWVERAIAPFGMINNVEIVYLPELEEKNNVR